MNVNQWVRIFAGFFIMLSLGLAHFSGQIDMSHVSVNRHANPGLGKYGTCGPRQGNQGDSGNFLHRDLSKYAHL